MSEMINSIDDTCDGCKYNRENQEGNCSRFVKFVDGKEKICGDKDSIGDSNDNACKLNTCPEHCFLNDELLNNGDYFGNDDSMGVFSTSDEINSITDLFSANENSKNSFISGINNFVTSQNNSPYYSVNGNSVNLRQRVNIPNYDESEVPGISEECKNNNNCSDEDYVIINQNKNKLGLVNFRCGDTTYKYGNYDLPNVSGRQMVNENTLSRLAINDGSRIKRTKWDSLNIRYIPENQNRISNKQDIQTFIGLLEDDSDILFKEDDKFVTFDKNGVDFTKLPSTSEWIDITNDAEKTNPELLRILNSNALDLDDLDNIYNFSTRKMLTFFNSISVEGDENYLYNKFTNDQNVNLTNKICFEQINEYGDRMKFLMTMTDTNMEEINIEKIVDIFMITENDDNAHLLEANLNKLLDTGRDPSDEALFIKRISNYSGVLQLGQHPDDIKYIEEKIKKFLGTNTEDYVDIFINHVSITDLCADGFATRPMDMLGNLLKLKVDADVNERELFTEKQVIKRLLTYVPNIMKKILDISERLELITCDKVSKKTQLYQEIYKDLFVNSNVLKFDLPNLGVVDFFKDFNRNIYTKIILLIFIGFVISKIISLFTVNVSV